MAADWKKRQVKAASLAKESESHIHQAKWRSVSAKEIRKHCRLARRKAKAASDQLKHAVRLYKADTPSTRIHAGIRITAQDVSRAKRLVKQECRR